MTERQTLSRLLTFLYVLSIGLFLGTIGELIAVKHYGDGESIRLVPFGLCVLGASGAIAAWSHPSRRTIRAVRVLMVSITLGSLLGVYEHLNGNYGFVHEVRPHASLRTTIEDTLTGQAPLMAPGILAVAALIAGAATYASVALQRNAERRAPVVAATGRRFPVS